MARTTLKRAAEAADQADELAANIHHHLRYTLGRRPSQTSVADVNLALALAVRERLADAMLATEDRHERAGAKHVYYLSIEFLMGRILDNALVNLGIEEAARVATAQFGFDLQSILEAEPDPALGNGGLGRLAACFLDSLATLDIPSCGYGIRYDFGLFRQSFVNGQQREHPDRWLDASSAWLIEQSSEACPVPVYGHVEHGADLAGQYNPMWVDWQVLIGIPYDLPVVGYAGHTVNRLRLFAARSSADFDMQIFNSGDYIRAVESKISSETVSKVLYPEDSVAEGRELRLIQEYFFVACAMRDILAQLKRRGQNIRHLGDVAAIQMNDTHPALAVVELMRILVDEEHIDWDDAWEITQSTLAYTNHTLLPEALERWPVALMERVLPRHMQIIYELNRRFLAQMSERFPGDGQRLARMSLIEEGHNRSVRMAHLTMIGSHSVNGVAALHSALIRDTFGRDFVDAFPDRFNNKTNGVSQRRWLLKANPDLSHLISERIGADWIADLDQLRRLEPYADDKATLNALAIAKRANKQRLAELTRRLTGVSLDPAACFDVQAKRMHEYKRQLLNVFSAIDLYLRIVVDGERPTVPRAAIFAGKAAPGYYMAKLIIRLINGLAARVNADPLAAPHLQVTLLPDYRVSLAEMIIPAADLSEQISTAGFEASGTGNMKFAMNGALTIGTLDGANIEIREQVGAENIYSFGLHADEVKRLHTSGDYSAMRIYETHPRLRRVVDALRGDLFSPEEPGLFKPIVDALLNGNDHYFVLADFADYVDTKDRAITDFENSDLWQRRVMFNIAYMGMFSSDRTIRQYASEIWKAGHLG